MYIIEYIIAIIFWTHCYLLDQLRIRKTKVFILSSPILSSMLFLSLCRSEFLTYIIFLLSEELLLTLPARQVCWQQILLIFVCLRKFLFALRFWKIIFSGYRILGWWLFSINFTLNSTLNISLYSLQACTVSEKLDIILIFFPL